jgi:hypothetical protein
MKTEETKNKFEEVAKAIDALGVEMDDLKGGVSVCAIGINWDQMEER